MRIPLLAASAAVLFGLTACSKPDPPPEPVRAVRTVTVGNEAFGAQYDYAADVRARTESRLGFRVGGKIVRRSVDLGDSVKAGQVMAQLDPQDLKLGQDAARAALVAAQANHEQTAADFKRFRELREQGFISSAELERRQTALTAAKSQLDQARAQANVQVNQAAYASLVADASGVITAVEAEPGMVVAAGTPVVRLAHDGPRDVVFSVPEDRISVIRSLEGQPGRLTVRFWGSGNLTLPAQVREVAAAADPVSRTFLVKADLGRGPDAQAVRLGQSATVTVDLPQVSGVTRLPMSALWQEKGRSMVWVVDKGTMTVSARPVQVRGASGNDAVLDSGVSTGQIVVTAGAHVLSPGQKVKFYVEPKPRAATVPAAPVAASSAASR